MEILDTAINGKKTSYFDSTSQLLHNFAISGGMDVR